MLKAIPLHVTLMSIIRTLSHRLCDIDICFQWASYRVAHAPGMPGTFSPPPIPKETAS